MVGEAFDIFDRGNGARICTKPGTLCGRLFRLEELRECRRPIYGNWNVIGQLDGKMVGMEMHHEKNAVYLFDNNDALEANPNAYEATKQDLGSLLLEALNRP